MVVMLGARRWSPSRKPDDKQDDVQRASVAIWIGADVSMDHCKV